MKYNDLPPAIPVGRCENLTGVKCNNLTPLFRVANPTEDGRIYWACKCDCGEYTIARADHLKDGHTKSCGCADHPNLSGLKFGKLTVIKFIKSHNGNHLWECKCDCGNTHYATTTGLLSKNIKSCKKCSIKSLNLTGQRFGKLVAISPTIRRTKNGAIFWKCQCDCGNIAYIPSVSLVSGNTKSCGCLLSAGELKIANILRENNIKFEQQKIFDGCIFQDTGKYARFDFYINDEFVLEYDGIQHFYTEEEDNYTEFYNMVFDSVYDLKIRDHFKTKWCLDHGIKIKRIPYWKYDRISLNMIMGEQCTIKCIGQINQHSIGGNNFTYDDFYLNKR